MLVNTLTIVN